MCCKITGVWYVLAVAVYLVYGARTCRRPRSRTRTLGWPPGATRLVFVAVPAASALFVGAVLAEKLGAAEAVNLLLPVVGVCALAVWRGLSCLRCLRKPRVAVRRGGAVPRRGDPSARPPCRPVSLHGVTRRPLHGAVRHAARAPRVGVLRHRRTGRARLRRSSASASWYAVGNGRTRNGHTPPISWRRRRGCVGLLLLSTTTLAGYLTMWHATTSLLPVGVFVGVAVLARHAEPPALLYPEGESDALLFLLLAMSAFVGLVQFPSSGPPRTSALSLHSVCSPGSRCSGTRPCMGRSTGFFPSICSRRSSTSICCRGPAAPS